MDNVSLQGSMSSPCNSSNSSHNNCSTSPPWILYPDFYIWLPVVYSVICAVGLTGNTAVIYVILKAPKMKTVTNLFILNLAIADDLFTLVLPINIAEHLLNYWPFGELLCKVILSIDHYNIFSSIYFLTVMSIDRYLVVLSTLQSKRMPHRTYRFAKIVSVCVWALVVLIVSPFTFFAGIYVSPEDAESRKSCVLSFPTPESFWFKASRIYTLVFSFILPVSTICVLYSLMLYRLRHTNLNSNGKALDKAKKKVTVMVFVVLAVCLFCWTPFHLSTVVALTTDLPTTPLVIGISYFITGLSYANSCLNPFLYGFLDSSFRKAFRKMLECWSVWEGEEDKSLRSRECLSAKKVGLSERTTYWSGFLFHFRPWCDTYNTPVRHIRAWTANAQQCFCKYVSQQQL